MYLYPCFARSALCTGNYDFYALASQGFLKKESSDFLCQGTGSQIPPSLAVPPQDVRGAVTAGGEAGDNHHHGGLLRHFFTFFVISCLGSGRLVQVGSR